jgi:hypothetical protein
VSPVKLADRNEGEEVGEEPNYARAMKPGPVYIIQNSLGYRVAAE